MGRIATNYPSHFIFQKWNLKSRGSVNTPRCYEELTNAPMSGTLGFPTSERTEVDISGYTVNANDSVLRVHIEDFDDPVDFIDNWPDITVVGSTDVIVKSSEFRADGWLFEWLIDHDLRYATEYNDRFSPIKVTMFSGSDVKAHDLFLHSKFFGIRAGSNWIVRRGRNLWLGLNGTDMRNTLNF